MKDNKLKSRDTSNRESTLNTIQIRINSELNIITHEFGLTSKKLVQEVEEASKKLAKKITKQIRASLKISREKNTETKVEKSTGKIGHSGSTKPVSISETLKKSSPNVKMESLKSIKTKNKQDIKALQ